MPSGERAPALDLLRGFALLGILVVNLRFFRGPTELPGAGLAMLPWWDRLTEGLVTVLAEGRFFPLFSFLLGYGFTVQLRRAHATGASIVTRHLRRSLGLFVLALAHAALLFSGDILGAYALLGLSLLAFRASTDRALLWWSAGLLFLGALTYGGINGITSGLSADGVLAQEAAADYAGDAVIYAGGSFAEVAVQRLSEWGLNLALLPLVGGPVLAAIVLGHWAARRRLLEDLGTHRPLLRRLVVLGAPVGLAGGALHAVALDRLAGEGGAAPAVLGLTGVLHVLAGAFLTAAYVGAGALLARRTGGRRWGLRAGVRAAGRMALTNYLAQSLAASLLFYGYGLGRYGAVGALTSLVLAGALWALQLVLSRLWFAGPELPGNLRVRGPAFGPVEWLLRWVAYGRRPRLLVPGPAAGSAPVQGQEGQGPTDRQGLARRSAT